MTNWSDGDNGRESEELVDHRWDRTTILRRLNIKKAAGFDWYQIAQYRDWWRNFGEDYNKKMENIYRKKTKIKEENDNEKENLFWDFHLQRRLNGVKLRLNKAWAKRSDGI